MTAIHESSSSTETRRLSALAGYAVLDMAPEAELDDIVRLAARICGTPVSLITLVDDVRQFFRARSGYEGAVTAPLDSGFCPLVVSAGTPLVIPDTRSDPAHAENPATRDAGVRFYAGVPLLTAEGLALGTLCVLDGAARPDGLEPPQIEDLEALARQVMAQFELRRAVRERDAALRRGRADEARHRQVLASAVDYAIVTTDLDGDVTGWNAGAETILGWTETEALGRHADLFFTPEDRADDIPESEMRAAREEGRGNDERWHLRKDGSRFWAMGEMMPLTAEDGGHVGYLKILRDRTEERRRGERLHLLARAAAELLSAADPDAALVPILEAGTEALGFDQTYIYVTEASGERLALTQSIGLGPEFRAVLRDVSCDLPLCGIVARTRKPFVLPDIQSSDEPRHAMAQEAGLTAFAGYPVISRGRLSGVISFASTRQAVFGGETLAFFATVAQFLSTARGRLDDEAALRANESNLEQQVSDRTRALMTVEEALRQSQKMEAVGQLTGGVAHDFNNLLTIIRSSVDFLRRPDLAAERKQRYLDAVSDTVERAAKLTGQLLAFARRQALTPEVFEVGTRLRAVADMLDTVTGSRIRVLTEMVGTPCHVRADVSQFETALVNMAVNARDAMHGEGILTLRLVCGSALPSIRGHAGSTSPFVAVSLTDTGSGIPADALPRVFEPFYTTKPVGQGTGLGLSQVFGFAKQSGGDIDLKSEPGRGSTFTLYLPEVPPPPRAGNRHVRGKPCRHRALPSRRRGQLGGRPFRHPDPGGPWQRNRVGDKCRGSTC
ncbi:GAF domain-containing protein [Methylorubrum subtropicum]|uniref:GAF domain-containing protein n=1 Tax=Methylorubrum subtropicum TaxID=3138812 RepID=UPI00399D3E55